MSTLFSHCYTHSLPFIPSAPRQLECPPLVSSSYLPRCVAHLLFPQSSPYPFRLGQQAEVAQYLLQIVPHLMHVANQLPNTAASSSSFADSAVVNRHEMDVVGGTQTRQSGHAASYSSAKDTLYPTVHPGGNASPTRNSQPSDLPRDGKDSDTGGLVKLTASSEDASVKESEGNVDDSRFMPPTTAEEKLEILKRLNSAIVEHRKKVGVESILDESSQSSSGIAPAAPNAEEGEMGWI